MKTDGSTHSSTAIILTISSHMVSDSTSTSSFLRRSALSRFLYSAAVLHASSRTRLRMLMCLYVSLMSISRMPSTLSSLQTVTLPQSGVSFAPRWVIRSRSTSSSSVSETSSGALNIRSTSCLSSTLSARLILRSRS